MTETVVVVGYGMIAARAIERLAGSAEPPQRILVFGDEPTAAYTRVLLPTWLAGDCASTDLALPAPTRSERCAIELRLGCRVVAIDRAASAVVLGNGTRQHYDHLVLATGSAPYLPALPGTGLAGVHTFRTLADVAGWRADPAQPTVVVGGGVLGLETACALRRHGAPVTLLHRHPQPMERQVDGDFVQAIERHLTGRGVELRLAESPVAIADERRGLVVFTDRGTAVPAARVIFCTGVRANTALAAEAGLACDRGIDVDDTMHTADPAISAIGECAEQHGQCFGVIEPLYQQLDSWLARRLGNAVAAGPARPVTTLRPKLPGFDLFVAGNTEDTSGCDRLWYRDRAGGVLRELLVKDDRLVGVRLLGATADAAACTRLIASAQPLGKQRVALGMGSLAA